MIYPYYQTTSSPWYQLATKKKTRPAQDFRLTDKAKYELMIKFLTDFEREGTRKFPRVVYSSDESTYGKPNSSRCPFFINSYHNHINPNKVSIDRYMKLLKKYSVAPCKKTQELFQQEGATAAEGRESETDRDGFEEERDDATGKSGGICSSCSYSRIFILLLLQL